MRTKIMRQRARRLKARFERRTHQVERIKQDCGNDEYGGLFTSCHIIQASGFVDFYFVGKYRGHETVFNATITTADSDYYDEVESLAFDTIDTPDNMPSILDDLTTPEGEKIIFDHYREHSEFMLDVMQKRQVSIPAWQVKMNFGYKFGIGLHIRINKPAIEVSDVVEFIHAFHDQGMNVFDAKTDIINKTPEELGVSLAEDEMFIKWARGVPNVACLEC